ncbi:MAG: DUF3160 domain-containing protein, partial [Candidatus Thorarchaeota archaeon]
LNRMGTEDLFDAYKYYWIEDLPIFITTDTLLHTWHLIFDHSLEDIEEYIFYPLFSELLGAMLFHAYEEYKNSLISENTLIYIAVAAKLANSTYGVNLPLNISNDIDFIVNSILEEISLPHAVNQFDSYRLKRFIDDFSQYMPRGHYTNSENLKNYFRLFKWFSRIPFFFDNYAGFRYLGVDPEEMIKSAIEVTWILKVTSLTWLGNSISGFKILQVFNSFLKAVLGKPNTVSPQVVDLICSSFFSEGWQINDIDINQFKEIILNNNSIPTPEAPFIIDALSGSVVSPKTFVILGEILTLDSYALNHLVLPYVGARFLPISLDFAATCLNSTRSKELLSDAYEHDSEYKNATDFLIDEIEHISGDEKLTIQWKWIESLKNLAALEPEYDNQINLPGFMNSSAWLDEKLTTILGSYAQLKHDLILYSKQSTTVLICSTPMGYVEPYPKFYQSLRFVSDFYKESLLPLESIGYNLLDSQYYYLTVLDEFHNATIMLENISIKELTGVPLNDNEKMFILETYQEYYSNMCGDTGEVRGWLSEIIKKLEWKYRSPDSIPNSRVSLVTDLHTDLNSQSVLHIATGLFEPLIAIVPGWNGQDIAVIGPVFSFYEFILQDYQRINDNEWRGVLNLWFDSTNRSEYYFHIFKRCYWAESYMVSPEITRDILFHDYEWFSPPSWFANVSQSEYNPVDPPDDPPNNPNMNSWNILDIVGIVGT